MSFLLKLFGTNLESEKENKFQEIEQQFIGKFELANLHKAQWLINRGKEFGRHNKFDQAIEYFKDAIKLNPNSIQARISWGAVLYKKRMFKEAVDVLETGLKGSTGFNDYYLHELLFTLGGIYMEIGDKNKAIDYLEKSLEVYEGIASNSVIMELQKIHNKSAKGYEQEWEERESNVEAVKMAKELLQQLK